MSKPQQETPFNSANLEPAQINDEMHNAFSKIILEASKIDHLVSIALFKLCKLSYSVGFALMGKTAISSKVKHLDFLVHASQEDAFCAEFDILSFNISKFGELRNALAHGIFMGQRDDRYLISLYANPSDTDGRFVNKVLTLSREEIITGVSNAALLTIELKRLFQIDLLPTTNPLELHREKPPTRREVRRSKTTGRT